MSEQITMLISTVGFPIVAYLLLFFKLDKTIGVIEESLKNNTIALQQLIASNSKGDKKE